MSKVESIGVDRFNVATSVNIETLAQGAVIDQFQYAFAKLLEDIADENTSARATRKVSIAIEVKPSEQRSHAFGKAVVKSSTYPNGKPIKFELHLHRTGNSISASEAYVEQGALDV